MHAFQKGKRKEGRKGRKRKKERRKERKKQRKKERRRKDGKKERKKKTTNVGDDAIEDGGCCAQVDAAGSVHGAQHVYQPFAQQLLVRPITIETK